jgi:hypothetical protein
MPKIRRVQQSQILQNRAPQQGGFGQGAGAESAAMEGVARSIGGLSNVALQIQDTVDKVESEKLNYVMQERVSQKMRELESGGAPEGKDFGEHSAQVYKSTVDSVLAEASNGAVRRNLSGAAINYQSRFNDQVQNIFKKKALMKVEDNFNEINARAGTAIQNAKAIDRPLMLMAQLESSRAFVSKLKEDPVVGEDVANRYMKMNDQKLREAFISSAEIDNDSAEEVLLAVQGKSGIAEMDDFFNTMDSGQRASAISGLNNLIKRNDNENFARARDAYAELSATNALGKTLTPAAVSNATSFAVKIKDPEMRAKALAGIRAESSFNVSMVKNAYTKDLGTLQAEAEGYVAKQGAGSDLDMLRARERVDRFLQAEYNLRQKDPKMAVDRDPSVQEAAKLAASGDPVAVAAYHDKVLASQEAMGMRRSLVSETEAVRIGGVINSVGNLEMKAELFDREMERFGSYKTIALNDLKNRKVISGSMLAYAYMGTDNSKQRVLLNEKRLKNGDFSPENLRQRAGFTGEEIDKQMRISMSKYIEKIGNNPGLSPLLNQMEAQVKIDAMAQGIDSKGKTSASAAVNRAVKDLLDDNFIIGTGLNTESKIMMPKFEGADVNKINSWLRNGTGPVSVAALNPDFNPKEFKSAEHFASVNEDNLFWQTDPESTDYVKLYMSTPTGLRIVTSEQQPVRISVKDISGGVDPISLKLGSMYMNDTLSLRSPSAMAKQRKTLEGQRSLGGGRGL